MLATGVRAASSTSAQVGAGTFIGIASCGFDSEANRIANETTAGARKPRLRLRGPARAAGWKPARFEMTAGRRRAARVTGYTVAAANSKAYGGGMLLAPEASPWTMGCSTSCSCGDMPKLRFLRLLPTVFKGEHIRQPNVQVLRAREVQVSADRPFTMYADGDPIAELPATVRALPGALRVMVPE